MRTIFLLCICLLTLVSAKDYKLGEGYQLGDIPVFVGGYFSLNYTNYTQLDSQKASLNNVAFLSYGNYKKFSYMAEMEFKKYYVKIWQDAQTTTTKDTKLHAERLYIDYTANENFTMRLGKYNSNIGYWNLTLINVLRDTTSSPATVRIVFPQYTTGLNLSYNSYKNTGFVLNFILQNNNSLDEEYNNFYIKKHLGIGLEYSYENISIKLNGGYFHKKNPQQAYVDNYYGYFSFLYNDESLKIMGAIGHRDDKGKDAVRLTSYIQASYELALHHYPVIRIEHYDAQINVENNIAKDSSAVFGYTYRPVYPIALKVEYQLHSNKELNQFFTSFSVMF